MKKEVEKNLVILKSMNASATLQQSVGNSIPPSLSDTYQEIVHKIAQDIRNQRKHRQRRQKELIHLLEVHRVLNKKTTLLKEQVSYYNEYVKACLDSLNSKKG
jgi:hypothetical protein